MSPDIDKIDRDRRKREDELLLAMLLLMDDARSDAVVYLRHGDDPQRPLANVLNRGVPVMAESMAEAHADAYKRLGAITGEDITRDQAGSIDELATQYEAQAQTSINAMIVTLTQAVSDQRQATPDQSARSIMRDAFESAGYTKSSTRGLDLGTERAIVNSYNNGMFAAGMMSETVTGFEHFTILDGRETDICHERAGLRLPKDHWYWARNWPQLHWGCRSGVLPIIGEFTSSDSLPVIPPMPGFGLAPFWVLLGIKVA